MAKITGRPKKARIQEKNIGFFVTKLQYFVIQQKAAKARVNISDYMRQVAVNGYVKAKWTEEERRAVKQLIGMSGELHQAVELARKEGAVRTVLYYSTLRETMDTIINTFCHDR